MRMRFVLLLFLFCWAIIPSMAFDFEVDGIYFDSLSSKTCEVVYGEGNCAERIIIPESVSYKGRVYDVVRIGTDAFYAWTKMKTVYIPACVEAIGSEAFIHCNGLISIEVEEGNPFFSSYQGALYNKQQSCIIKVPAGKKEFSIPTSVSEIGEDAFFLCRSLKKLIIPSSVTHIRDNAFAGCDSLIEIDIPNSVVYIGEYAFSGCKSLESINIPNSVKKIGRNALSFCTSLSVAILPSEIESIPYGMFNGCTSLKTITVPSGVITIGDYSFAQCDSLQTIIIPNTLISLGNNVFSGSISLKTLEMPEGVTTIGDQAFEYCVLLDTLTLPSNVAEIGKKVFNGCKRLVCIDVSEDNIAYKSIQGALYDHNVNRLIKMPSLSHCDSIPATVSQIEPFAFYKCESITKVRIPKGVSTIGEWAFVGCNSLDSVYMETPINLSNTYLPEKTRTLYVPFGKKADFESSSYFISQYSLFKSIEEYVGETTSVAKPIPFVNGKDEIYNLQGIKVLSNNSNNKGVYIINRKKVMVK